MPKASDYSPKTNYARHLINKREGRATSSKELDAAMYEKSLISQAGRGNRMINKAGEEELERASKDLGIYITRKYLESMSKKAAEARGPTTMMAKVPTDRERYIESGAEDILQKRRSQKQR